MLLDQNQRTPNYFSRVLSRPYAFPGFDRNPSRKLWMYSDKLLMGVSKTPKIATE